MSQEKILLVDDEPEVLSALRLGLNDRYEVFTSCSTEDALEIVATEGPFPVIMSDLKMPGVNGLDFLEQARELSPDSSAILLTGQGEMNDAIRAVNSGIVFKYLNKPCNRPDLHEALLAGIDLFKENCMQKTLLKEYKKEHQIVEILSDCLTQSKTDLGDQIECHIKSTSLQAISGDFYEILPYNDDCYDIIIGDVMGKGLSAALAGIAVKNVVKLLVDDIKRNSKKIPDISDILHLIELELHKGLVEAKTFITLFYLRINLKAKRLSYINRGHPGALLLRESGQAIYLGEGTLPLGVTMVADQVVNTNVLEFNDQIVLYSDGVTELLSKEHWHPFDVILSCLEEEFQTPREIIKKIEAKIGTKKRTDDMTLMVMRIKARQPVAENESVFLHRNADELFRLNNYLEDSLAISGDIFKIAVIECFTNILRHTDKTSLIKVTAHLNDCGKNTVLFSYEGEMFSPERISLPDCSRQINGFGLYLVEKICEKVEYYSSENGMNHIKITAKEE